MDTVDIEQIRGLVKAGVPVIIACGGHCEETETGQILVGATVFTGQEYIDKIEKAGDKDV